MPARMNLEGQTFGRLVALHVDTSKKFRNLRWVCRCECGTITSVPTGTLRAGHTRSCGCGVIAATVARNTKHGSAPREGRGRLYRIWKGMRQRCNDPNAQNYSFYGGRGIRICEAWDDFVAFRDWACANGYTDDMTLDRRDNGVGYSPDNCHWITQREQMRNTRSTRLFEHEGKLLNKRELAQALGLKYTTLTGRMRRARLAGRSTA